MFLPIVPAAPIQTAPALVELFTSEGCSSCPSADALLARYAAKPDVILLSEHVDYWNRLGWKDRFSSAFFSDRQSAYARRFGLDSVYTPQAIVNGEAQFVGSDESALRRALALATTRAAVTLTKTGGGYRIAATSANVPADLVLATVLPLQTTKVERGENGGRTLTHVGVVKELKLLGPAEGTYDVPNTPGTSLVAFVQARGYAKILGAAKTR